MDKNKNITTNDETVVSPNLTKFDKYPPIPPSRKKRNNPDSPDLLPASQKQTARQIRRRNSMGDLTDIQTPTTSTPTTTTASRQQKTMIGKILEALKSPDVMDTIMPIISTKIVESISDLISNEIQECVESKINPLLEINKKQDMLETAKQNLCKQAMEMQELSRKMVDQQWVSRTVGMHDKEFEALYKRIDELEQRLEGQKQYSRRTSLRFHNIKVPTDRYGRLIHAVDTDKLVLKVINDKLG